MFDHPDFELHVSKVSGTPTVDFLSKCCAGVEISFVQLALKGLIFKVDPLGHVQYQRVNFLGRMGRLVFQDLERIKANAHLDRGNQVTLRC